MNHFLLYFQLLNWKYNRTFKIGQRIFLGCSTQNLKFFAKLKILLDCEKYHDRLLLSGS